MAKLNKNEVDPRIYLKDWLNGEGEKTLGIKPRKSGLHDFLKIIEREKPNLISTDWKLYFSDEGKKKRLKKGINKFEFLNFKLKQAIINKLYEQPELLGIENIKYKFKNYKVIKGSKIKTSIDLILVDKEDNDYYFKIDINDNKYTQKRTGKQIKKIFDYIKDNDLKPGRVGIIYSDEITNINNLNNTLDLFIKKLYVNYKENPNPHSKYKPKCKRRRS